MTDDELLFYKREKLRFNELLGKLNWTENCLLEEKETLIQCPNNRGHRFPIRSKHLKNCQLEKEGYSKEHLKELRAYEQEKQAFNQSGILLTPSKLSNILHRSIPIKTDLPLSVEQTTILFSPHERSLIAEAIHNEAMDLGIVPPILPSITDNYSMQLQDANSSQQVNKLAALREQKRRRTKYVTRATKQNFYDNAREMLNTGMILIQQINEQINSNSAEYEKDQTKKHKHKHKHKHKYKHDSTSKRKRHSSHTPARKHHRHSKKRHKE